MMRDTSSRSSMIWPWALALRSMVARARRAESSSSWPLLNRKVQPRMAWSGVRS